MMETMVRMELTDKQVTKGRKVVKVNMVLRETLELRDPLVLPDPLEPRDPKEPTAVKEIVGQRVKLALWEQQESTVWLVRRETEEPMGRQETVELQDSPEELADLGQKDPRDSVE